MTDIPLYLILGTIRFYRNMPLIKDLSNIENNK